MQLNQQGKQIFYIIIYIQAKTIIKTYIPNKGYTNINKNKHAVKKRNNVLPYHTRTVSHSRAQTHTNARRSLLLYLDIIDVTKRYSESNKDGIRP